MQSEEQIHEKAQPVPACQFHCFYFSTTNRGEPFIDTDTDSTTLVTFY